MHRPTFVAHDLKRGLWHCVVLQVDIDVSEEHNSVFSVERFGQSQCFYYGVAEVRLYSPFRGNRTTRGWGAFRTSVRPHNLSCIHGYFDL